MPGRGNLTITGQAGDVMQESARAALSYARSRAEQLKIDPDFQEKLDLHIHLPEGAQPEGRTVGRDHDGDGADLGADPAARCATTSR